MDIFDKIGRDQAKVYEKTFALESQSLIFNKAMKATKLYQFFVCKDDEWKENRQKDGEILAVIESTNCIKEGVITKEQQSKLLTMIRSTDPEMNELGKQMLNDFRNQRLNYKKNANLPT